MNHETHNGKSIASILAETRDEFKEFIATRIALFRTELQEKLGSLKRGAPLAVAALLFLATAYVLLTLAAVGVVLALLPANPWRWCLAFLVVAILWSIVGSIFAYTAMKRMALKELVPRRTLNVLKGDGVWIRSEVKNQI